MKKKNLQAIIGTLEQNKTQIDLDTLEFEIFCADEGYNLVVTTVRFDPRYNKLILNVSKENEE